MTTLCEMLGIEYPIFQGAMARIATADIASAVSNAGGLGIIASGGMTADQLRAEIQKCKTMTDKPFAVNLMLMMRNCPELVDVRDRRRRQSRDDWSRHTETIHAEIQRSRH